MLVKDKLDLAQFSSMLNSLTFRFSSNPIRIYSKWTETEADCIFEFHILSKFWLILPNIKQLKYNSQYFDFPIISFDRVEHCSDQIWFQVEIVFK